MLDVLVDGCDQFGHAGIDAARQGGGGGGQDFGDIFGEVFGDIRPATVILEVSRLISPEMLVEIEAEAIVA